MTKKSKSTAYSKVKNLRWWCPVKTTRSNAVVGTEVKVHMQHTKHTRPKNFISM